MKEVNRDDLTLVAPGVYQKNEKTYYIECSIMKTLHYCNRARLDKLINSLGTIDVVGSTYISRAGKSTLPKTKKPNIKNTSTLSKSSSGCKALPIPEHMPFKRIDEKMYAFASKDGEKCIRGTIFKTNKGYCNGCNWYSHCQYSDKQWADQDGMEARLDAIATLKHTYVELELTKDLTF